MTTPQDIEDLLARMVLRDRAAFSALYGATSAKLFGVVLRVLKDHAQSEEVLQEVYIKIWQKADRYRVTGHSPMTWLITLTRNHAIDWLRARPPISADIDAFAPVAGAAPGPEARMIAAGEARRITDCLPFLNTY